MPFQNIADRLFTQLVAQFQEFALDFAIAPITVLWAKRTIQAWTSLLVGGRPPCVF
jgi:hypothetical protein